MELIESLPRLSEDEIWAIVADCCRELSSIGSDFLVDEDDFIKGQLFEATGLQGKTGLGCKDHSFMQELSFNRNIFRAGLEDLYLNTVYHELLHVIVNKYMIIHNIISLNADDTFRAANREFFRKVQDNNGHGGLWLELAIRANKVLDLVIPITPYCSSKEMDKVFEASLDDYGNEAVIEVNCQDCENSRKFLTITEEELPQFPMLLAMYYDTKHHKKNNFCGKCHGTMYIIIRDQRFIDLLDQKIEEFNFFFLMKDMMN